MTALYGEAVLQIQSYPGFLSASDSTSAYMCGYADNVSSKTAYTHGALSSDSSLNCAYIRGGIYDTSSTSAYCAGGLTATSQWKKAFIIGIERSSKSAYLSGQILRVNYIMLGRYYESGLEISSELKRYRVLTQGYGENTAEKLEAVTNSIGGKVIHYISGNINTWTMIIRVRDYESDSRYGTLADLEALYSLNDQTQNNNRIYFEDHRRYGHVVEIVGEITKNLITTIVEGETSLYLYKIILQDNVRLV